MSAKPPIGPRDTRRRARNLLLDPALQLRLPIHILWVTVVCAVLLIANGAFSFRSLFWDAMAHRVEYLDPVLRAQMGDFLIVTVAIVLGYALVVLGLSVLLSHRLVGPTVALRRHVEALKNGDYGSRVRLRKHDAFAELAHDLDELAELLEKTSKE